MDKQMITMIEQNQTEDKIEKQKQIDNIKRKRIPKYYGRIEWEDELMLTEQN